MKVEKVERVDMVTVTLTREELYLLKRVLHNNIAIVDGGVTLAEVSIVRNAVNDLYFKAEDRFGDE